jgi:hypothetical protein
MKAKKVYEYLNMLKPKTEEEIQDVLRKLRPNDALISSIDMGNLEGVKYSLERGADANLIMLLDITPLDLAFKKGNDDIIDFLVSLGAKTFKEIFPLPIVNSGSWSSSSKLESISNIFKPKELGEKELEIINTLKHFLAIIEDPNYPKYLNGDIKGDPQDIQKMGFISGNSRNIPYFWFHKIIGNWDDGEADPSDTLEDLKYAIEQFFEELGLNESVQDVFKPKTQEEIKQSHWEWVRGADEEQFPVKIPRTTKGDHEVYLISKSYENPYSKELLISGFIYVPEEMEWKIISWNLDGTMTRRYSSWSSPKMSIDPITSEELEKLPFM